MKPSFLDCAGLHLFHMTVHVKMPLRHQVTLGFSLCLEFTLFLVYFWLCSVCPQCSFQKLFMFIIIYICLGYAIHNLPTETTVLFNNASPQNFLNTVFYQSIFCSKPDSGLSQDKTFGTADDQILILTPLWFQWREQSHCLVVKGKGVQVPHS